MVIERDEGSDEYIVTDESETAYARGEFRKTLLYIAAGLVVIAIGAVFLALSLGAYGLL